MDDRERYGMKWTLRLEELVQLAAAAFLLSPAASYITGVTLLVDGGMARAVI